MSKEKTIERVSHGDVVENEWREQYDREWGLGLVTSVDQGNGDVWVTKIGKDEEGYYLTDMAVKVNKSRLRPASVYLKETALTLGGLNV